MAPTKFSQAEGYIGFEVPSWTDDAFRLAKPNEDFRNALLMFSESLQLEGPHPSITLISYMASLQSLGRIIEINKNKQLKAILDKVRSEEEVEKILRYYRHRSETAHHGVLWGGEDVAQSAQSHTNPFARHEVPFLMILWNVRDALVSAFKWILDSSSATVEGARVDSVSEV